MGVCVAPGIVARPVPVVGEVAVVACGVLVIGEVEVVGCDVLVVGEVPDRAPALVAGMVVLCPPAELVPVVG